MSYIFLAKNDELFFCGSLLGWRYEDSNIASDSVITINPVYKDGAKASPFYS
jgi:hypothetical protein